jgi:threonyl-tRNA synthetase
MVKYQIAMVEPQAQIHWSNVPIRNESTGALSGLTRVRQFHQDDAHIFCTESQMFDEISKTLAFVEDVYTTFRFSHYDYILSTRNETKFVGEITEWERAEDALKKALSERDRPWAINKGDAAFYGPKIDIVVRDAHDRMHQTATIQLDFQLPNRFGLRYRDEHGTERTPVIVHRAVLGSVERMMAILMEHTAGRWPFWLSPRQAIVVPVFDQLFEYANEVKEFLSLDSTGRHRFYVDVNVSGNTMGKMIRDAQLQRYNFALVVGQKERESRRVSVRRLPGEQLGSMALEEVRGIFEKLDRNHE